MAGTMTKYKEIKDFLQTCGNMRAELRLASKQLNWAVYQLESHNKLLLKALELACDCIYENLNPPEREGQPDYWLEQATNESKS